MRHALLKAYLLDIVPRVLVILALISVALAVQLTLKSMTRSEWQTRLALSAPTYSNTLSTWLDTLLNRSSALAANPALIATYSQESNIQQRMAMANRVISQHVYGSGMENVYLFDGSVKNVIAAAQSAPLFPQDMLPALTRSFQRGEDKIIHFAHFAGAPYLLTGSLLRNDITRPEGYVLIATPLRHAFSRLNSSANLHLLQGMGLHLFLSLPENRIAAVLYFNESPRLRFYNGNSDNAPLNHAFRQGVSYEDRYFRGLTISQPVSAFPQLYTVLHVTPQAFNNTFNTAKVLTWVLTLLLSALALIWPTNKPYGRRVRATVPGVKHLQFTQIVEDAVLIEQEQNMRQTNRTSTHHAPRSRQQSAVPARAVSRPLTSEENAPLHHEDDIFSTQEMAAPPKKRRSLFRVFSWKKRRPQEEVVFDNSSIRRSEKESVLIVEDHKKTDTPEEAMAPVVPKPSKKRSDAVVADHIRTAAQNNRFKLLYQPIIDINTNKAIMFEVYTRILDHEGDVITPAEFMPVAYQQNLVNLIDQGAIRTVFDKHLIGEETLGVPLAVNLAGDTFENIHFLETLMSRISGDNEQLTSQVVFEIRAREVIEDKKVMNFIRECFEMGIRFSFDYFGGGEHTLTAAKKLRFSFVKVDAQRYSLQDKEGLKELMALSKAAQEAELPLIVERVEDELFLKFCQKIGIPYAQGYFIATPSETPEYTPRSAA